jgi:acetyl esterase/lipase
MNNVIKQKVTDVNTYIFNEKGTFAIVFLHGGAYMNKAIKHHYLFANKLAQTLNAKVYFPLYPLLESGGNATVCNEKMKEFVEALPEQNIILAGDSAGGGLSLSMTHNLQENNITKVSKVVAICPWLDVSMTNEKINEIVPNDVMLNKNELQQIGKLWMSNLEALHPLHSPLYANLNKELPILIISGSNDILNPDTQLFCQKNSENNIVWYEFLGMHHDFVLFNTKESRLAFEKIKEFILE